MVVQLLNKGKNMKKATVKEQVRYYTAQEVSMLTSFPVEKVKEDMFSGKLPTINFHGVSGPVPKASAIDIKAYSAVQIPKPPKKERKRSPVGDYQSAIESIFTLLQGKGEHDLYDHVISKKYRTSHRMLLAMVNLGLITPKNPRAWVGPNEVTNKLIDKIYRECARLGKESKDKSRQKRITEFEAQLSETRVKEEPEAVTPIEATVENLDQKTLKRIEKMLERLCAEWGIKVDDI